MPWLTFRPVPLFPIYIEAHAAGIRCLQFDSPEVPGPPEPDHPLLRQAVRQLEEYFAGRRRAFDLPLDLRGTPFQVRVWEMLRTIPYGEISTYGDLARQLGRPGASRAVGAANGANPVAIVVPCHRVIGAGGALTGYGGGIERKRFLLALESLSRMSRTSS
jgi:methylated-DNA-[protein]-cysteine S-methyltransferase